jgi:RNA polymerase sigma-70 factor (ECF subfamily)
MTIQARVIDNFIAVGAGEALRDDAQVITLQEFLALYDQYFPRVYNYARYRCGDAHTADDLTAAIFERAFDRLCDFCPQRGSFGAWLFSMARGIVSHHLRAECSNRWLPIDDIHEIPDGNPTPEDRLILSEAQNNLLAALAYLSDRDRDLLSLKFGARLTNRRIAEVTGLSDNNVGIILYRALHKLRAVLDEWDPGYE